ncbi:hypothetical protein TcBrA4_0020470 [Trypanosoma cruzi]|nr:hypothetical protein TcBrA4_0020470 [Trypanosoma cruzi]
MGHQSEVDGTKPLRLRGPQFNYEPFNSNSINIRFWSWNYRGCWHQTCPPIVTRFWMGLNIPIENDNAKALSALFLFAASSFFFDIGQFARLLPSVEVVAISQAPSPESNPNPRSRQRMAVHYTAIAG